MPVFLATTTVSVLRGTSTDEFNDEVDNDTIAASGIPASIMEQTRRVFTQDSQQPRIIRYITGRVPSTTLVEVGDRVRDEATDLVYAIDAMSQPGSPVHTADIRLDLKRVT
jgi:hypothetical protein